MFHSLKAKLFKIAHFTQKTITSILARRNDFG